MLKYLKTTSTGESLANFARSVPIQLLSQPLFQQSYIIDLSHTLLIEKNNERPN